MKEQIVSKAYAKSIIELGERDGVDVAKELTSFNECINAVDKLEILLFSEVFTPEEKEGVLKDLTEKLSTSTLVKNFLGLLLQEKRFGLLPLIYKEVIVIDDDKKGFLRGVITGADDSINPDFQKKISEYLKDKLGKETQLHYHQSDKVTAGYKVTIEDLQLDASLDNQLENFKESILNS